MKTYSKIGARNRTLLTAWGLAESYRRPIAGTKCKIEKSLDYSEGFVCYLCSERGDRERIAALMEEEVRQGCYTQSFFDAIDKNYKDVVVRLKTLQRVDPRALTNEELLTHYKDFLEMYITTIHPMVLGIYASDLSSAFEAALRKILGEKPTQEEMTGYTALLLTPTRLTTVQKEEQLLFEIQDAFEKQYPSGSAEQFESFAQTEEMQKRLETVAELYGWFHMEYIGEPKVASDYRKLIAERIEDLRNAGVAWGHELSPVARLATTIKDQQDFLNARGASKFFRDLVFAMQEYLIVIDYSKSDLIEGIYYFRPFLEEVGRRVGLPSWVNVRYVLPDEVQDLLLNDKRVTEAYIAERKKNVACLLEDDEIKIVYGDEAMHMAKALIEDEDSSQVHEFKGLTAYPGKVTGRATIVRGAQDREKFKTGEILVCHDTTTELTSVIKKAAAIVADRGSLLSHTAIVAREFKIPCIVQAKIATKVIKDGDELEVDASGAIVRILSQSIKN
ncbi:MAG: PEP-utilizing enzyme [Candidatus Paceibacterota bacterium]|jgi:phosphohistidine swiveling domain-containing protein